MTIPAFLASGTRANFAGATSVTPAIGGTQSDGNILIAHLLVKNNVAHSCSTPGWELLSDVTQGVNLRSTLWVARVPVGGSVAAPVFSWSSSGGGAAQVHQITRDAADISQPLSNIIKVLSSASGSGNPHTGAGGTTSYLNSLALYIFGSVANTAYAQPTGWVERTDNGSSTGNTRNVLGTKDMPTVGDVGAISITGATQPWVGWQLEIYEPDNGVYVVADGAQDFLSRSDGATSTTSLSSGTESGYTYSSGVRFQGIRVPHGATITSATLTMTTVSVSLQTGTAWGSWHGDKQVNAPVFSASDLPHNITRTTASTPLLSNGVESGQVVHDVTSIVQELIDQSGWVAGNALRFASNPAGSNGRVQYSDRSNNGAVYAATLSITYSVGGGSGITITAAAGGFLHSGKALNLLHGWAMPVSFGSFSLNSSAVSLRKDRLLTAQGVAFSLGSTPAGLAHGWTLSAAAGSFQLQLAAAGMRIGRAISAAVGGFNLASSAQLYILRRLIAQPRGFVLSSSPISLRKGGGFNAQSASYALASPAAFIRRGFQLPAQSGALSLAGQSIVVRRSLALPAAPATYAAVFRDAILLRNRALAANPGHFLAAAAETRLGQFFRKAAAVGSFLLNPTQSLLALKRQLLADAAAFDLTGTADLRLSGPITVTPPSARIYTPFFENRILVFSTENRIMLAPRQLFEDRVISP